MKTMKNTGGIEGFRNKNKLSNRTIDETNKSWMQFGIEDSVLSYKAMQEEEKPAENIAPSIANNSALKSASSRVGKMSNRGNYLTSKEIAKDILNRSGIFKRLNNPAPPSRMSRAYTNFFGPKTRSSPQELIKAFNANKVSKEAKTGKRPKLRKTGTIRDQPVLVKIGTFIEPEHPVSKPMPMVPEKLERFGSFKNAKDGSMKNILNQLDKDESSHNIQELDVEEEFQSADDSFVREIQGSIVSPALSKQGNDQSANQPKDKSGSQKFLMSNKEEFKLTNSNGNSNVNISDSIDSAIKNFKDPSPFGIKLKFLKKGSSNQQKSISNDLDRAMDQKDEQ